VGAVSARTASLEVIRTLLNSVLANDADFMCCDIADYYLGTPMDRPEFMCIHYRQLSATITRMHLHSFRKTKGCMAYFPEAGLLAQLRLVALLSKHGYTESTLVPSNIQHDKAAQPLPSACIGYIATVLARFQQHIAPGTARSPGIYTQPTNLRCCRSV
jgi:hypothetical protein